jgi:GT2 family glycosyltransferase
MPKVTVVIAAFNAGKYIGEALASVQAQTLEDVEVIVVDDGSTDDTIRQAERFAPFLDLTIIRQANAGPSAARNLGIRRARAPYCALLDADDIMLPGLLAAQCAVLDADPTIGLVVSDVSTFDEHGVVHDRRWDLRERSQEAIRERLLLENFITTSAVMAPTERLLQVGLFNVQRRIAEDYEVWLRLAARWDVGLINQPLVRYRYSPGSLSDNRVFSSQCALEVVELFLKDHPRYLNGASAVRRRALAKHMANVASAAQAAGRVGTSLTYLIRSMSRDPWVRSSWKMLVKTALPQSVRPRRQTRRTPVRAVEAA